MITQKNQKQGAARNNGVRHAKGKYIWFVDSDDYIKPNIFGRLVSSLDKHNLDVLAIGGVNINEKGEKISERNIEYRANHLYSGKEVLLENKFNTSIPSHIFKKDFLAKNKLEILENIYFEDNEFMVKVFDKVQSFMYLNLICYYVFLRGDSSTRTTNYSNYLGLITVIRALVKYIEENELSLEAQKVISIHIARCQNSLLHGTRHSKTFFLKSVKDLKKIEIQKRVVFS